MLTKTIEYVDYNGDKQIETCYFNMTKVEIAAMQVRMDGKFIDYLKSIINDGKVEEMFNLFRDLILDSYGQKSEDGKRFHKTPEMRKEFEESIAFSEVLTELMQDPKKVRRFTKGILPPDFQDIELPETEELLKGDGSPIASLPSGN